jgi:aspartyl-tRNA(Asn)/glutamyl-tRNA(Gln) amidotransferase subunit B
VAPASFKAIVQETRGWNEDRSTTYRMRVKESSDDYRYFPEPDLPPLTVDPAWLDTIRSTMPELPAARRERYATELGLSAYDAAVMAADLDATRLFEATVAADPDLDRRAVATWVTGEYLGIRNRAAGPVSIDPEELAHLVGQVASGAISRANAREVLSLHVETGEPAAALIAARGFRQISDAGALGAVVDEVLAANERAVADYRAGKQQAIGFLVGQVMKATRGQANAAIALAAVRERLDGAGER